MGANRHSPFLDPQVAALAMEADQAVGLVVGAHHVANLG